MDVNTPIIPHVSPSPPFTAKLSLRREVLIFLLCSLIVVAGPILFFGALKLLRNWGWWRLEFAKHDEEAALERLEGNRGYAKTWHGWALRQPNGLKAHQVIVNRPRNKNLEPPSRALPPSMARWQMAAPARPPEEGCEPEEITIEDWQRCVFPNKRRDIGAMPRPLKPIPEMGHHGGAAIQRPSSEHSNENDEGPHAPNEIIMIDPYSPFPRTKNGLMERRPSPASGWISIQESPGALDAVLNKNDKKVKAVSCDTVQRPRSRHGHHLEHCSCHQQAHIPSTRESTPDDSRLQKHSAVIRARRNASPPIHQYHKTLQASTHFDRLFDDDLPLPYRQEPPRILSKHPCARGHAHRSCRPKHALPSEGSAHAAKSTVDQTDTDQSSTDTPHELPLPPRLSDFRSTLLELIRSGDDDVKSLDSDQPGTHPLHVPSTSEVWFGNELKRKLHWLNFELTPGFRGGDDNPSQGVNSASAVRLHLVSRTTESSRQYRTLTSHHSRREVPVPLPTRRVKTAISTSQIDSWRRAINQTRAATGADGTSVKGLKAIVQYDDDSEGDMTDEDIDTAAWALRRPPPGFPSHVRNPRMKGWSDVWIKTHGPGMDPERAARLRMRYEWEKSRRPRVIAKMRRHIHHTAVKE